MTRFVRTIICSLLVLANTATGLAAYGAVWCQESDGRVSLETPYESDACHERQASGSDRLAGDSLAPPGCVDVPVLSPWLRDFAPPTEVDKLSRIVAALVVVFVHQPELSLHQRVLPQPDPVFPSPTLSALNTVVLLV